MVANRQERGCGRQHRECSRVDRISGLTNGRRKRTKSGSKTSIVPVSYSCRTKIVQAVLDRQRSGVMATIWWFCHDHDRSGRSAMIGKIGKKLSAQCDLGLSQCWPKPMSPYGVTRLQWVNQDDKDVVMRTMRTIQKHYDSVMQNTDVKKSEERMYRSRGVILVSKRYTT